MNVKPKAYSPRRIPDKLRPVAGLLVEWVVVTYATHSKTTRTMAQDKRDARRRRNRARTGR